MKKQNSLVMFFCVLLMPIEAVAKKTTGSLFSLSKGVSSVRSIKNYDANTLTKEQLKKCYSIEINLSNSANKIFLSEESLKKEINNLNNLKLDLSILEGSLKSRQQLGLFNEEKIEAFNSEVAQYNKASDHYNKYLETYLKKESAHNVYLNKHNLNSIEFDSSCAEKNTMLMI